MTTAISLQAFPNPANDELRISTGSAQLVNVSVTNAVGQSMYAGSVRSEARLATADWAAGVYHVCAGAAALKIVVQH